MLCTTNHIELISKHRNKYFSYECPSLCDVISNFEKMKAFIGIKACWQIIITVMLRMINGTVNFFVVIVIASIVCVAVIQIMIVLVLLFSLCCYCCHRTRSDFVLLPLSANQQSNNNFFVNPIHISWFDISKSNTSYVITSKLWLVTCDQITNRESSLPGLMVRFCPKNSSTRFTLSITIHLNILSVSRLNKTLLNDILWWWHHLQSITFTNFMHKIRIFQGLSPGATSRYVEWIPVHHAL